MGDLSNKKATTPNPDVPVADPEETRSSMPIDSQQLETSKSPEVCNVPRRQRYNYTPTKSAGAPGKRFDFSPRLSPPVVKGRIRRKVMWTKTEKKLMEQLFGKYLNSNSHGLPSMTQCEDISKKYRKYFTCTRTGRVIYAWVRCEQKRRND